MVERTNDGRSISSAVRAGAASDIHVAVGRDDRRTPSASLGARSGEAPRRGGGARAAVGAVHVGVSGPAGSLPLPPGTRGRVTRRPIRGPAQPSRREAADARPRFRITLSDPCLGEEEVEAAAEAIRSGWISTGPRVAEF